MNKKLLSVSIFVIAFAMPAMASPTYSSNEFPSNGLMQADYTYVGQATSANMDGVTSGTVNAVAEYEWDIIPIDPRYYLPANSTSVTLCTSGYFCPGVETDYENRTPHYAPYNQGLNQCPDGFGNSDAGASANTQCYRACDAANMGNTIENFEHAGTLSGRDYYGGTSSDTCVLVGCEGGYHLTSVPNLTTVNATTIAYVNNNGNLSSNAGTYGLTSSDINTFVADYGDGGVLRGHSRCNHGGNNGQQILDDETGNSDANTCYCSLDGYTPLGGTEISLSTPWYQSGMQFGTGSTCANYCSQACAVGFKADDYRYMNTRFGLFGYIETSSPATCEPDTVTITINWTGATDAAINANNAGTCTYGGDFRTPQSVILEAGKIFKGWQYAFNTVNSRFFQPNEVIPNICNFENFGIYSGTIQMLPVFEDEPLNISCSPGWYLPANTNVCEICPENHYCPGGDDFLPNFSEIQGKNPCPDNMVSPVGTANAGGCGVIMHVGDDIMYLTSQQQTHPALAARVNGRVYYAKTTPVSNGTQPMNNDTTHQLHTIVDGVEYSIHDNTINGGL